MKVGNGFSALARRLFVLVLLLLLPVSLALTRAPDHRRVAAAQGLTATAVPEGGTVNAATAPALFFTDITSGPKTGGQDDLGAFIAIFGEGFGAQRGDSTVTIGNAEVAKYVIWGQDNGVARNLDMIVIQPGPNVTTGDIVVTVNGRASNPLPFAVRTGQIYFVIPDAPNATDANPGAYATPFKTLYRPRQVMQAGDIAYIKGGAFSSADPEYPGWDATLLLFPDTDANGTAERPIAYIGYPGDPPVLGGPLPMRRAILVDQAMDYYVFANLRFTQYSGTLQLSGDGHRVVGNYSHDGIFSYSGVIGVSGDSAHYKIFGNLIRNNGEVDNKLNGSGFYVQGFGTNQDIDFGWNQIQDQHGSRAIQVFGHADGDRVDNLRIHDNLLRGSELNNIVLGGSDGSTDILGAVYVYNNIIVGSGSPGLRINDPQGTVIIQNNALYDNGTPGIDGNAQVFIQRAGAGRITLQNNILYAESGQSYYQFEPGADASAFNPAGSNLVYNAGACLVWDVGCINANPLFASTTSMDFRLQAQSPAIDAGANTGLARDYAGVSRPQGQAYDIGAHEHGDGTTLSTATPTAQPSAGTATRTTSPTPQATATATRTDGVSAPVYLPLIVRWSETTATPTSTRVSASPTAATPTSTSTPGADNPNPPVSPVKLIFVHHSTGGNWLADPAGNELGGGLGSALMDNRYFVSATNYGWTVAGDTIGDRTDIGNWWEWFRGPQSANILAALYGEDGQNVGDYGAWPRLAADPGGENRIIVIKSCFPNSALQGDPGAAPPPIAGNPLRAQDASSEHHTVANAKGIYVDLLEYFRTRQDKLFVVITAPPLQDGALAANARAFNNWLVNDWLSGYPYRNVAVFDFYSVLTSNGGDPDTNDLGWASGNHHRWWNEAVQHQQTVAFDTAAYPSGDDHPNRIGNEKATGEFAQLLNVFYNRWVASR